MNKKKSMEKSNLQLTGFQPNFNCKKTKSETYIPLELEGMQGIEYAHHVLVWGTYQTTKSQFPTKFSAIISFFMEFFLK